MKRVYIPFDSGLDYSQLNRYGEPIFLIEGPINRWDTNLMLDIIKQQMVDAKSEDYIVVSSLNIFCSLICSYMTSKFNHLNLLIYNKSLHSYIERKVSFHEL